MKISIVIPYYNEYNRRNVHFPEINKISEAAWCHEVIYVNDGGSDDTEGWLKEIHKASSNVVFTGYKKNKGKGGAVKEGILRATGDYVLYTDFDLAIDVSQIPSFCEKIKGQKAIAIATRKEHDEIVLNISPLRKICSFVFHKIMKLIISLPQKDTQCGFKMFDQESAKRIFNHLQTFGFAFDVEVLLRAQKENIPVYEVPVKIHHDDSQSTINIWIEPFRMLWQIFKIKWRMTFEK